MSESAPGSAEPNTPGGPGASSPGGEGAAPTRARKSHKRLIALIVIGVVVVWTALAGLQLLRAREHAQNGLDLLRQTQSDLGPAELIRGKGLDRMRAARAEFDQASESASSPLLMPFKVLPFVGRQVRSVDTLANSAAKVVHVGVDTMEASTAQLATKTQAGPDRVQLIARLGGIAKDARGELADVSLGPSQALIGPLASARKSFAEELGKVRKAMVDVDDASTGLAQMAQGPSKYLVLAANNAEMRAGSGMLLSAGTLTMADGRFQLGPMTDTAELAVPPGRVPISGDLAARWGWVQPNEEWRYLAMSPDFEKTAALAAQMWKAKTGEDVDGVLALDPIALQGLVAASGPVQVGPKLITKDNVVKEILLQQYLDFAVDPNDGNSGQAGTAIRHERSSDIARAIVDQLDHSGWDTADLVDDLRAAAEGRHVLAWSSKPEQQRGWKAAGLSGGLQKDSLLVSVLNRAGNKLDQFLPVTADVTHRPVAEGTEVEVKIGLANQTPTEGMNVFVEGPFPFSGFNAGEYRGILAVNIPDVARNISLDGGSGAVVAAGPDGNTRVVARDVIVERGQRLDATLRFTVPKGYEQLRVEPSARYPAISWSADGQHWQDDAVRTLDW